MRLTGYWRPAGYWEPLIGSFLRSADETLLLCPLTSLAFNPSREHYLVCRYKINIILLLFYILDCRDKHFLTLLNLSYFVDII